jgi:hypothetical protein
MGRYIFTSLSALLLFTCLPVWSRSNNKTEIVPFKIYGQQLIVVQGSIGSLEKRNLIIDTGAYPSVIDRDIARKLSLSGHQEDLDAIDKTLSAVAVTVPFIEVGPTRATSVRGLVQDLSEVSRRIGIRVDGLIGLDVLSHRSFVIDYGAKKISFGPVDRLPSSVPMVLSDGKVCVDVRSGENSMRLLVASSAERIVLLRSHVPWIPRSDRARSFASIGGSSILQEVRLDELQLADTPLNSDPVYLSVRDMPVHSFDGFLSTIQFEQVAFDFERQEFGWMVKGERRERVHIASKPRDNPSFPNALARQLTKGKDVISVPEACGSSREKICSLQ